MKLLSVILIPCVEIVKWLNPWTFEPLCPLSKDQISPKLSFTLFSNCKMCWTGTLSLKILHYTYCCVCLSLFIHYLLIVRTLPTFQKEPAHLRWVCPTRLCFKVKHLLSSAFECFSTWLGTKFCLIINSHELHIVVWDRCALLNRGFV